ncbi:uncharacterized protein LOC110465935 isoform X2 [Mizuhopecten yessoensis]|uniref:uncharacterized protein LOC110465935 isoform X2 n=1 Tax=Mizuhopecten yessoensis TaxID=6573 RepID=UPI000B45B7B9|nr:uncharacterized protein LOC110465935 isoform X2 [Mizuhopecten yessoensis]
MMETLSFRPRSLKAYNLKAYQLSLTSIHEQHDTYTDNDNDDKYTVASTGSTAFTLGSNYTTGTDNFIPVSRLSKHSFKLRTTSSFPSILNLYQHPILEEGGDKNDLIVKRHGGRRRHMQQSKRGTEKGKVDWDQVIESRTKQEQRAIRIEAVARDQMEKYEKYIKNLKAKVEIQREARKKQYEDLTERLRQKEEEDKKRRYLVLKRPKMEYVHDRKYLKKLPKSKFTKMVLLSDDLQKKGVLHTRTDVDRFWNDFGKSGMETDIFATKDPLKEVQESNEWIGRRLPGPPPPRKDTYGNKGYPLPPLISKKKKKKQKPMEESTGQGGTMNAPSIHIEGDAEDTEN